VPLSAAYGQAEVLALRNVEVNQGAIATRADDGLHVVAQLGDANGNQGLDADDVTRIQRVIVRSDSGFDAHRLIDPLRLADVNRDGRLSTLDAALVARAVSGVSVPAIPPIPVVAPALQALASAQNAVQAVEPGLAAKASSGNTRASTSAPVIRLTGGALDFGIDRPLSSGSTWVSQWVGVADAARTNAWKLTI
jgi:hypothetical protein